MYSAYYNTHFGKAHLLQLQNMQQEKSNVIETVKKVMPAVVSITITQSVREVEKELSQLPKRRGKQKEITVPEDKIDAHGMVQVGGGSGFIVNAKGIILTNKHVLVGNGAHHTITLSTGESYDGEIVARDPVNDVAIFKIKTDKPLPIVALGDSTKLELGQTVLAFGNALGIFQNTVSAGIVSGLSRSVSAYADPNATPQEMRGLIQTDAAINPGNSGGPLVDIFGRAVGINAAVVSGAQSIAFAIPIHAATRDLEDLEHFGRIRRPLLGLRYITINDDLQIRLKLPINYGAFVTEEHPTNAAVTPEGPAAKAGIKDGDIILSWNDKKVTAHTSIPDYLDMCSVGDTITIRLLRPSENKEHTVTVVLTERK